MYWFLNLPLLIKMDDYAVAKTAVQILSGGNPIAVMLL